MRDFEDVLAAVLATVPESEAYLRSVLTDIQRAHDIALMDIPEAKRGWGRLADTVWRGCVDRHCDGTLPVRLPHAEAWRADLLAAWRGCTVESLAADGLVKVEAPPPDVAPHIARLMAFCEGRQCCIDGWPAPEWSRDYVAQIHPLGADGRAPRLCVEVHNYEGRIVYKPLLYESTGIEAAEKAIAAFRESVALAEVLNAEYAFDVPYVPDPDDAPF